MKIPLSIKLTAKIVAREDTLYRHICYPSHRSRSQARKIYPFFEFKNDERLFAKELLTKKQNFWLFRTNQQEFSGDFIAINMASPWIDQRKIYVIDLKQNAPLKFGGGGAGIQFTNASSVLAALATEYNIIVPNCPFEKISGAQKELLSFLANLNPPSLSK